jgi:hypothetical protein
MTRPPDDDPRNRPDYPSRSPPAIIEPTEPWPQPRPRPDPEPDRERQPLIPDIAI